MGIISKTNIHNAIRIMTTNESSLTHTLSSSYVAFLPVPLRVCGGGGSKVTEGGVLTAHYHLSAEQK